MSSVWEKQAFFVNVENDARYLLLASNFQVVFLSQKSRNQNDPQSWTKTAQTEVKGEIGLQRLNLVEQKEKYS